MDTRFRLALVVCLAATCAPLIAQQSARAGDAEPAAFAGMVEAHNAVRRGLSLPPLRWSAIAASQAQGWADQLAREGCALRYNPDPARRELFGENVLKAWSSRPYEGYKRSPHEAVRRWAEEGQYYDYAANECRAPAGRICGSYLQVIWETTEVVGCGRARCETSEIWVCNYTPRGGQEGLRPYGNPPPAPAAASVQPLECFARAEPAAERPPVASREVPTTPRGTDQVPQDEGFAPIPIDADSPPPR